MILGLGLLANGMRTGKYRSWAAIVLALAVVCHGIVAIYTVVARSSSCSSTSDGCSRFWFGLSVGVAVVLLSAFWIGPFLGNHDYMTDMKYGARPEGADDSFWDMFFPLTAPLDFLVTTLAVIGFVACDRPAPRQRRRARRHRAAHRRRRLRHPGEPAGHRAALEPRLLPLLYFLRYLLMMVGIVEIVGLVVNAWRDRPVRESPAGSPARSPSAPSGWPCSLVLGFMFEVLPGDGRGVPRRRKPVYRGVRCARRPTAATPRATGGRGTTSPATRAARRTPSTTTSCRRWPRSATTNGCGRAMWENNEDNGQYGTTMALMLLPHWTDGCIASMEGLFFEASGTTPYHFLTTAAMSKQSSNPVRELRYDNNDAAGRRAPPAGARRALRDGAHRRGQAAGGPARAELLATSGPWEIYQVADSDIVVPLDVQPVVVAERRRRPARAQPRARHELVPAPRRVGGDPRRRRSRGVAAHRRRRRREPPVPDPTPADDPDTRGKQVDIVVPEPDDRARRAAGGRGQRRRDRRAGRPSTSTRSACPCSSRSATSRTGTSTAPRGRTASPPT